LQGDRAVSGEATFIDVQANAPVTVGKHHVFATCGIGDQGEPRPEVV
jgi:hypothetical protein